MVESDTLRFVRINRYISHSGYTKILARPELASIAMGVMICVQGIGQFLGTFLVQALLGPDLLNWFFAGAVIMVLGLAGAGALALIKKMP